MFKRQFTFKNEHHNSICLIKMNQTLILIKIWLRDDYFWCTSSLWSNRLNYRAKRRTPFRLLGPRKKRQFHWLILFKRKSHYQIFKFLIIIYLPWKILFWPNLSDPKCQIFCFDNFMTPPPLPNCRNN